MYMRRSRLSKDKQHRLIEHFIAVTTARCASNLVGVNFKTFAYYFYRLGEIIVLGTHNDVMPSGEFEVDESYTGGVRKGKQGRCAC